jgi:hypothetical protein
MWHNKTNKMKITSITYGKTINIGNYQSIRVDFTAQVDEGELPSYVLHELKIRLNADEQTILKENPVPRK